MSANNVAAPEGRQFWFISTPAVMKGGVLHSRMIVPFATEGEARAGVELLQQRYPGSNCYAGQITYTDPIHPEELDIRLGRARGDLAWELAGPDPRAYRKPGEQGGAV